MIFFRTKLTKYLAVCMLLGTVSTASTNAQDSFIEPDEISNAALIYWQAFSFLPQLNEEQQKALDDFKNGDNAEANVVQLFDPDGEYMTYVDSITADTPCNWQIPRNGVLTYLPHLTKARVLAKLLIVDGCRHAAVGNNAAASKRFSQALLLARNVDDGPLVCVLVGQAIEKSVSDALSGKKNAELFAALSQQISKMPGRATLQSAIEHERDLTMGWIMVNVVDRPVGAKDELLQIYSSGKLVDTILQGTQEERREDCDELSSFYGELIQIAGLSSEQSVSKLDSWSDEVNQSRNLLATGLLPSVAVFAKYHESNSQWESFVKELGADGK